MDAREFFTLVFCLMVFGILAIPLLAVYLKIREEKKHEQERKAKKKAKRERKRLKTWLDPTQT
jgi:Mg2+/citrate symporter